MERDTIIVRTSIIGIVTNMLLAGFKAVIGLVTHSIAITLDAVNNLSDAMSSIVTIIGTKLASRLPDREHPWGHGRAEYLSAMVISVIILYAGLTSLIESVKKIIDPQTPDYSTISLIIVGVAVLTKIVLGTYVKGIGKQVSSESLTDSGQDALMDAVISASTLLAALVYIFTRISLEAYLGTVISLIIVKSGIDMLRSTISEILGERIDVETAKQAKKILLGLPEVHGVYDMIFHDYGPQRFNCSAHVEVEDTLTAEDIDLLQRQATMALYREMNIVLTALSIYAINTKDETVMQVRKDIYSMVSAHPYVLEVHGFLMRDGFIQFDVIVSFDAKDRVAVYQEIFEQVQQKYPQYTLHIALDTDFSFS